MNRGFRGKVNTLIVWSNVPSVSNTFWGHFLLNEILCHRCPLTHTQQEIHQHAPNERTASQHISLFLNFCRRPRLFYLSFRWRHVALHQIRQHCSGLGRGDLLRWHLKTGDEFPFSSTAFKPHSIPQRIRSFWFCSIKCMIFDRATQSGLIPNGKMKIREREVF